MKPLHYIELGASLFIPAAFTSLNAVVCALKYPELKSIVIDFEDGLSEDKLNEAEENLKNILKQINEKSPLVFVRSRDAKHLSKLLNFEGIENVRGFVLAKFSLQNAEEYLCELSKTQYYFMPSIEGQELFEQSKLLELREILLRYKEQVLLVRFGLEDMLKQLRMRRGCDESMFDLSATSYVLGSFISAFKSVGFGVSGGVYPCFKDDEGFTRDVKRDLKEGLFSKTIIHPSQIALTNELYKVSTQEYEEALQITQSKEVFFAQNSKMAEVNTMKAHSQEILLRAKVYGVRA